MSRASVALVLGALSAVGAACATTGAEGEGDRDLPSAGVGPFRRLADSEVRGIAPFVLEDREARYREPWAIVERGEVVLFAVAGGGVVVRTRASEGRSFFGTTSDVGRRPSVVLAPELGSGWEGNALARPSVVRRGDEWLLYYAAAGGIGLARSRDGFRFTREPAPVLAAADVRGSWETTPPGAPGAWVALDGRVHLLYAAGSAIGEAESDDGVVFRRRDAEPRTPELDPVLSAAAAGGARVTEPCPLSRTTPVGRAHLRVLFTVEDAAGGTTVRFAGRFGDDGPLEPQAVPVYVAGQRERAPSAVVLGDVTLLYVGQDRRLDGARVVPGIAAAVAPADRTLPAPAPFPDGP